MKRLFFFGLVLIAVLLSACAPAVTATSVPPTAEPTATEASMSFQLTSDAFAPGQSIPVKYTCAGKNISPALAWNEPPTGAHSFALILDDPDAGSVPFVHWVLFNIPVTTRALPEAFPPDEAFPDGSVSGRTSMYATGYMGPCPPSGTHRYSFRLYALDATLDLPARASKNELLKTMENHILAQSELIGTFGK